MRSRESGIARGSALWPNTPMVRTACLALAGVAALVAVAFHLLGPVLPYDDATITYRHADHLVEGPWPV